MEIFHLSQFEVLPVTCETVKRETSRDKILSQVYRSTMTRWNQEHNEILKSYYSRRNELTTFQGCVMWCCRIVIPKKLRLAVLNELQTGHLGVVRMKTLARRYIWWPKMDQEIENLSSVKDVVDIETILKVHRYIIGSGLLLLGPTYMSTMQVLSKDTCSC